MTSRTRRPRSNLPRRRWTQRWMRREGTTFLELLLVVTILAVAAAAVLPRFSETLAGYRWQQTSRGMETLLVQAERQARLRGCSLQVVWEEKEHRFRLEVDAGSPMPGERGSTPWGEPAVSTEELRAFIALPGGQPAFSGGPRLETTGPRMVLSIVEIDPQIRVSVEGFPLGVSTTGEMSEGFLSLSSARGELFSIRIPEDIVSAREFAR